MIDTPEALQIRADSRAGVGLVLPIAKALAHLQVVHEALSREWDLTPGQAVADVREAITHFDTLLWPSRLLSDELEQEIIGWKDEVREWTSNIAAHVVETTEPLTEDMKTELRRIITQTWALCSLIDRELTGIPAAEPGLQP